MGEDVVLYLASEPEDGDRPVRSIYWFGTEPLPGGWRVRVEASRHKAWTDQAVAADFPGGDKRVWRLATRFAQVRHRDGRLGVSPPMLGPISFERMES